MTAVATVPAAERWTEAPPPPPSRWGRPLLARLGIAVVVLAAPVVWVASNGPLPLGVPWLVLALALVGWVAGDRPRPSFLPQPGPGALPAVLVLTGVAAWSVVRDHGLVRVLVPYGLALAMPLLTRLGGGAVERAAAAVGRFVGTAVATVLFSLLGLALVVVPWVAQRLVGADPLHPRAGWSRRSGRNPEASQPWVTDASPRARTWADRARSLAGVGLLVGAAALFVRVTPLGQQTWSALTGRGATTSRPFELLAPTGDNGDSLQIRDRVPPGVTATEFDPNAPHAATADATWLKGDYAAAQGWALDPRNAWRPVNPHRLRDFESRDLTVRNGARRTWTPPPGPRPRLRVWMFGGSTAYGLNQRDDHTIASELARTAHANGIDLEVVNKGMNGQLHWMEAERFAWDLLTEPAPDLVLFYDGVNDQWESSTLNRFGTGDVPDMYDPTMIDAWINATGGADRTPPSRPAGAEVVGRTKGPLLQLTAAARTTMERYDRARRISRATAEAHGIPVTYLWQPSRFSRPLVMAEPHHDTANENRSRLTEQLQQKYLAKDVVDLTDALRSSTDPLFTDDVHHNEEGARLIAGAMFSKIRTQLELLTAAKGTTR